MSTGGKGSIPRPVSVSKEEYESNWDNIFNKSSEGLTHPTSPDATLRHLDITDPLLTEERFNSSDRGRFLSLCRFIAEEVRPDIDWTKTFLQDVAKQNDTGAWRLYLETRELVKNEEGVTPTPGAWMK